jgi:hypothetical protein
VRIQMPRKVSAAARRWRVTPREGECLIMRMRMPAT